MTTDGDRFDDILVIIPVRNEAATIAEVIQSLQEFGLTTIRVVDNGSTDESVTIAEAAGAQVLHEPIPGYGRACWRGLQQLPPHIKWILFCDGDGSDDLSQLPQFLAQRQDFDLILGNRRATASGRKAMTPVQNFGNRLATFLIRCGWNYRYCDLGPLRLIRRSALEQLAMQDRGFGWTVEMQVRAVECGLRICELPVGYRSRRGGHSKISGTVVGSIRAGFAILSAIAQLYLHRCQREEEKHSPILWLSALLLLVGAALTFPHGDFREVGVVPRFWFGIGVMSLGFVLSWAIRALSGIWFWGVALLARVLLLPMYPGDDVWRYLWEGYIQTLGFSPYELAPTATELVPYQTAWWSSINHLDVSAIYPPVAQLGFRALAAITPAVLLFKVAFVLADLLVCGLLGQRFGYRQATLYAWNPLVIYSFAGGAHYDSWFILPLVAAWLLCESSDKLKHWVGSALLLGISVAVKWMSLPVLGFLGWRAWRRFGGRRVAIVLLCGILPLSLTAIPFCQPGACPLIPTDSNFVTRGRSAEFVPYGLGLIWDWSSSVNWIYGIPLGLVVLWLLWQVRDFQPFAAQYFFALLVLSPIVHAWYFTWVMPFAVATGNLGARAVSLSAFIYFALQHRKAMGNADWFLTTGERLWLWLPFVLGWLWTTWQQFGRGGGGSTLQGNEPQNAISDSLLRGRS